MIWVGRSEWVDGSVGGEEEEEDEGGGGARRGGRLVSGAWC